MKINWFSPLPPAKTGIADYTFSILPALQNEADLVLWTNQSKWDSKVQSYGEVRQYDLNRMPWFEINRADCNIYHIGNNRDFHSDVWQISRQCPGIVILHELKLHHFFGGLYKQTWNDKNGYLDRMRLYYGTDGEKDGKLFWNNVLTAEQMSEDYPLTLLALENSVGVVTHNLQAYQSLKTHNQFFLAYAPLPYIGQFPLPTVREITPSPPYKLIIFGHLGFNRRVEAFLEALSLFSSRKCFHLDIYGDLWDKNYVDKKIKEFGLEEEVTLHGFVKETELDKALANSNLAINLRYPTMGEASASQLRIWSHALPSLVTQVGWYAGLPEDTVKFVRPESELQDIHQHLQSFIDSPQAFVQMGRQGRLALEQNHDPGTYAANIVDFARQAKYSRYCSIAHNLVERVGEQISLWNQPYLSKDAIANIADSIYFLSV